MERVLKLGGRAAGTVLIGFVLYKWFIDPSAAVVMELGTNRDLPVFEQP